MTAKRKHVKYRKKLETKRKDLTVGLSAKSADAKAFNGDDGTRDYGDVAQSAYTKEFLFSMSTGDRRILQLVDEAIGRIESDEYGVCVACGKNVQPKRLEAIPWARHCIQCQELQDQGRL